MHEIKQADLFSVSQHLPEEENIKDEDNMDDEISSKDHPDILKDALCFIKEACRGELADIRESIIEKSDKEIGLVVAIISHDSED